MTIAELARPRRPSQRSRRRKRGDNDGPQPDDADYGMSERRIYFLAEDIAKDLLGWHKIMPIGSYETERYGTIEITAERVQRFARNFAANARGHDLPVNREHVAELGAVGWFKEVDPRDDGLYAKFRWSDEGTKLLDSEAFKFFSPEFYDTYKDPKTGDVYEDLLVGCALTNYPQFYDLPAIAASEAILAEAKKAAESFEDRIAEVAEELEETYGFGYWIEETFEDSVIVRRGDEWWSLEYTADASGEVSLGAMTEVERTWSPASLMAEWTSAYVNELPDSSFAYVESGGTKDADGKTSPRKLRHFPIKDANGKDDAAHVRNALSRASQSEFGEKAMPKIRAAAKRLGIGEDKTASETRPKEVEMAEATKPAGGAGTATKDPAPADPTKASEGNVLISASDLATLREQAAQAPAAMAEAKKARETLRLMAVNETIAKAKTEGRIVPAQETALRDRMIKASDEDFEWLKTDIEGRPKVIELSAVGSGAVPAAGDDSAQLDAQAQKYMTEHPKATYREALIEVSRASKGGK